MAKQDLKDLGIDDIASQQKQLDHPSKQQT